MRTILALLFVIIFLIASVPILLVELIVKKINPMAADMSQLRIVQWAFRTVQAISGVKVTVIGRENIPNDHPVVYVSNHQSFFDIILTYSMMKLRTGFISKDAVSHVPVLSNYARRLYCIFLDRKDLSSGMKMIKTATAYIKSGVSIFIYPEGTRNKSGNELNLAPFHDGSLLIAARARCPVIPVSTTNTEDILEKHFPWIHAKHVVIEFGEPVMMSDLTKEERKHPGEYFRAKVLQMLIKNQKLV